MRGRSKLETHTHTQTKMKCIHYLLCVMCARPWRIMLKLFPIFLFSYSHTFHPFFFFSVPIFLDFSNKIVKKKRH